MCCFREALFKKVLQGFSVPFAAAVRLARMLSTCRRGTERLLPSATILSRHLEASCMQFFGPALWHLVIGCAASVLNAQTIVAITLFWKRCLWLQ
mmetsp:Transcript_52922/g.123960  ORF Transcript_52922/g.123960 Transcript_52922/m.123960 type:complete len:95 (-) Transcript_52922:22-306(-)